MKTSTSRTSTLLAAAIALTGCLAYSWLIYSQCGSTGLSSFFTDVRAFHTRAGC